MNAQTPRFLLVLLMTTCLSLAAMGQSVQSATERIKERLPQIDNLKAEGAVGETSEGYLAPREDLGPRQQSLLEAENADRRIIYQSVAVRTGQTAEAVGRQRAIRIAELARPGVWLQKPGGEWYRKPG